MRGRDVGCRKPGKGGRHRGGKGKPPAKHDDCGRRRSWWNTHEKWAYVARAGGPLLRRQHEFAGNTKDPGLREHRRVRRAVGRLPLARRIPGQVGGGRRWRGPAGPTAGAWRKATALAGRPPCTRPRSRHARATRTFGTAAASAVGAARPMATSPPRSTSRPWTGWRGWRVPARSRSLRAARRPRPRAALLARLIQLLGSR